MVAEPAAIAVAIPRPPPPGPPPPGPPPPGPPPPLVIVATEASEVDQVAWSVTMAVVLSL